MELREMTCIITGAGGAVGRQVVETVLSSGATVVSILHGTTTTLTSIEPNYYSIEGDLTDGQCVNNIFTAVIEQTGRIDVLINVAGGFRGGQPLEETTMEDWKAMLAVNFISTLNTCRGVLSKMKDQGFGRIINIGSSPGENGMALASPYAVSKAAVHVLTKSIAKETKDLNINALVLVPGTIDTPQNRQDMPDADWDQWLKPVEIANQITQLLETDKFDRDGVMLYLNAEPESPGKKDPEILSVFDHLDDAESPKGEDATLAQEEESDQLIGEVPQPGQIKTEPSHDEPQLGSEPVLKEGPVEDIPENLRDLKTSISSDKASFSMVTYLKTRGLHQKALEMLDKLLEKGDHEARILKLKQEIEKNLGKEGKRSSGNGGGNLEEAMKDPIPSETGSGPSPSRPKLFQKTEAPDEDISDPSNESLKEELMEQSSEDTELSEPDSGGEVEKKKVVEMNPADKKNQVDLKSFIPTKKKKKPSSTLITLLIILFIVSGLAIQDWVSPESSLVSRMVSFILNSQTSESVKLPSPNQSIKQTTVIAGFIDTLSEKDEGVAIPEPPFDEEKPGTAAIIKASQKPDSADTTQQKLVQITDFEMDTTQFDTAVWISPQVPEDSVDELVPLEDTAQVSQDTAAVFLEVEVITEIPPLSQDYFARGLFHKAAQAWYSEKKAAIVPGRHTIVLEYVCMDSTIRNAHKALDQSAELFILPKTINSRSCYIVCLGEYPDLETAKAQLSDVPSWFTENEAKPTVRLLIELLQ